MQKAKVQKIVDAIYPKIIEDFGPGRSGIAPIELSEDIYARHSGIKGARGEASKTSKAEYDWDNNKIYIYYPNMKNEEDVLRSILHEYTHTKQDPKKEKKYRALGYKNNPHELAARKAEDNWKSYKS